MAVSTAPPLGGLHHALEAEAFVSQGEPGAPGERRPTQRRRPKPEPGPDKTRPGTRSLENVPPRLPKQREGQQNVCTSFSYRLYLNNHVVLC